jgi:hypothetical protein
MDAVKRILLLVALVAGVAGLAVPGTAGAAVPCRDRVYNDWYHDGRIASTYPISCYRDALTHIRSDADIYTSLSTDIRAAMRAAIRAQHGTVVPKQVGHGLKVEPRTTKPVLVSVGPSLHDQPPGGGAIADTASSTPLPILVLGGIALALAAAGAIGTGVRHARRRRR